MGRVKFKITFASLEDKADSPSAAHYMSKASTASDLTNIFH